MTPDFRVRPYCRPTLPFCRHPWAHRLYLRPWCKSLRPIMCYSPDVDHSACLNRWMSCANYFTILFTRCLL